MKCVIFALALTIAFVAVTAQSIPTKRCPPGEHSVLYCPRRAEPSCNNPKVHDLPPGRPAACGIPDCFCDEPNVRNTGTNRCIPLSEC